MAIVDGAQVGIPKVAIENPPGSIPWGPECRINHFHQDSTTSTGNQRLSRKL